MVFNGVVTADRPVEPSFGLFSVARVQKRGSGDEHWIGGYYVESSVCGTKTILLPQCSTPGDEIQVYDKTDASPFFHVTPFGILETYSCPNSIGINAIDRRAYVVRQLDAASEYAVEHELWNGDVAQTDTDMTPADRWLVNGSDAALVPGTAYKPTVALGLVEQTFATSNPGIQATIHVTPLIATILDSSGAFTRENDRLTTPNGSLVTINRAGLGPIGPSSGGSLTKHWIYATGPVHVDLGSEELITVSNSEIVNPVTNEVTYVAERPAAVYFDGCSWFGALADATL